jgi:predicted RNA-binding protein YlqC (UPF0109 family)
MNIDAVRPLIDLLSPIIRGICKYPEQCVIEAIVTAGRDHIKVHPHMADVPKLVGRTGVIINGLNLLAERMGARMGLNARIELVQQPEKGEREPNHKVEYDPGFRDYTLATLLTDVAGEMSGYEVHTKVHRFSQRITLEMFPDREGSITAEDVQALNEVFKAYGRAQGAGKVEVECQGVESLPGELA